MTKLRFATSLLAISLFAPSAPAQAAQDFVFVIRHDPAAIRLNSILLRSLVRATHENAATAAQVTPLDNDTIALEDAGDQPPGVFAGRLVFFALPADMSHATARKLAIAQLDILERRLSELLVNERHKALQEKYAEARAEFDRLMEQSDALHSVPADLDTPRNEVEQLRLELRDVHMSAEQEQVALQVLHEQQAKMSDEVASLEARRSACVDAIAEIEAQVALFSVNNKAEELAQAVRQLDQQRATMNDVVRSLENATQAAVDQDAQLRAHTLRLPMLMQRADLLQERLERAENGLARAAASARESAEVSRRHAQIQQRLDNLSVRTARLEEQLSELRPVEIQHWF